MLYLRATLIAQLIKICLQCTRPWFDSWVGTSPGEGIGYPLQCSWASFVAQLLKNPPVMQETWVPSLGWEIPWTGERLPTPVSKLAKCDWVNFSFSLHFQNDTVH